MMKSLNRAPTASMTGSVCRSALVALAVAAALGGCTTTGSARSSDPAGQQQPQDRSVQTLPAKLLVEGELLLADEHDDKQEQHHDRPRVHRHLDDGDKGRVEGDIHDGDDSEVRHHHQDAVHEVASRNH